MPQQITESGQAVEAAAVEGKPGRFKIQLITPGWGSSGYYSPEVLKEAARDKIYPAGTRMMLDHPTWPQSQDRPEGEVMNWAATLEEDAYWDGKGLVAEAEVYSPYNKLLAQRAKWLGVSIRASAEVKQGEAEGRKGRIVEKLMFGETVDFVTKAGRGGQVLAVLEAERNLIGLAEDQPVEIVEDAAIEAVTETIPALSVPAAPAGQSTTESSQEMNMAENADTELREQLRESAGQVTSLTEARDAAIRERDEAKTVAAALRVATDRALKSLAESSLSPKAVARIVRDATAAELALKDGLLDVDAFDARVKECREDVESLLTEAAPVAKVVGFNPSAKPVTESGYEQSEAARQRIPFNRPAAQKGL